MEPPFLTFYAFNTALKIEPLSLRDGKIMDNLWIDFQDIVNIAKDVAQSGGFNPVLNSSGIPALQQKQTIVLLSKPFQHFSDAKTFKNLITDTELRPLGNGNPREVITEPSEKFSYQPIITIGYEDIMQQFARLGDEEKDQYHNLDPRFKFLDSSIWHRYVPVLFGNKFIFPKRFSEVIHEIAQIHKDELYRTNAARAMLEFQLRMMRESYIYPVGEHNHSKMVTPFKFHSETEMKEKADRLMEGYFIANGMNKAMRWRFLLIDDYANKGISADGKDHIKLSKKDLIEKLLKGLNIAEIDYPRETDENDSKSATKHIINKCLNKLENPKQYDVLLLDYLLARIPGKKGEREYGFEFLLSLQQDSQSESPKYKRGPFMRHWIFPISSFPFALYDKLRQLGIDNFHELWHLSGGGDPITTPQLFRYYLLSFLKRQIEESCLTDKELAQYLKAYADVGTIENWIDIIEKRLENIGAKILILKCNEEDSVFSKALYNKVIEPNGYKEFIEAIQDFVKSLKEILKDSTKIIEFEKEWFKTIHNEDSGFQARFGHKYENSLKVIRNRFEKEIYGTTDKTKKEISNFSVSESKVVLGKDYLIYFVPPDIGKLDKTTELVLKNNKISSLPDEIKQLNNLRSIDLENNHFREFPIELESLLKLSYVNLSGNPIAKDLSKPTAQNREDVLKMIIEGTPFQLKRKRILSLVEGNKLEEALETAVRLFKGTEWQDELILLKNRFSKIKKEKQRKTALSGQIEVSFNEIGSVLLEYLNDMEKKSP